jgi:hypothetical protein
MWCDVAWKQSTLALFFFGMGDESSSESGKPWQQEGQIHLAGSKAGLRPAHLHNNTPLSRREKK